jgi:Flp pilus assembly protein TadG
MGTTLRKGLADQSGSVAVITGIVIFVLLGCAAVALDIAHLVVVKSQLQKAADAGAMAGARGLWPQNLGTATNRNPSCTNAQVQAADALGKNQVDGTNLTSGETTIQVGTWNYASRQFTPGCTSSVNAVQVSTSRNDITMFFAQILNINTENLSATSTAVMDCAGAVGQGCLPIAVNKDYTAPGTQLFINFTPDPYDNGGWFADPPDRASATTFKDYIDNAACPPLHIGDFINLQNGNDTSVLQDLQNKLDQHPGGWDTFFPVVDTDKFNQSQPITAFVPVKITAVADSGNSKGVYCTVVTLEEVASALPGGPNFGALAPPKMVN